MGAIRLTTVLFFAFFLSTDTTQAQFHGSRRMNGRNMRNYGGFSAIQESINRNPFRHSAVGFTYTPISGEAIHREFDPYGTFDTSISTKIKGGAFGLSYGMSIPTAAVASNMLLGIQVGLNFNLLSWKGENKAVFQTKEDLDQEETVTYDDRAFGFFFGLPLGIDLMTGGEATLDPEKPLSFNFGGGIFPMLAATGVGSFAHAKFKAPLYLKAELGLYGGVCWRIRAMYLLQSPTSFTTKTDDLFFYTDGSQLQVRAQDQLMLSLLVTPIRWNGPN